MAQFYFNLPTYEQLTRAQQVAVSDPKPIALSGGPGTGKSVVSLWRHIVNHTKETRVKSQLLTYTTTLAYYLKACSRSISAEAANYVDSSLHWVTIKAEEVDEIIMDEAQDMSLEFNKSLKRYSTVVSYGADDQQIIKPESEIEGEYNLDNCSPEEELRKLFRENVQHRLDRNFRSTQRIIAFAKEIFDDAYIPDEIIRGLSGRVGDYPRMLNSNGSFDKQDAAIIELIRQFMNEAINIAVLVPFANPPYNGLKYTTGYFNEVITKAGIDCSCHNYSHGKISEIKNVHITTFKSAKGLEFDIVIIPNFQLIRQNFKVITWRDFYVGITRAKSSLYLISSSDLGISDSVIEKVKL